MQLMKTKTVLRSCVVNFVTIMRHFNPRIKFVAVPTNTYILLIRLACQFQNRFSINKCSGTILKYNWYMTDIEAG